MENLVWILHLLVAIAVIVLVLLQHGKGADMGAAFGGGTAGSLFGSSGSANFLSKSTGMLATVFFLTSMGLAFFALQHHKPGNSVVNKAVPQGVIPAPVTPADVPAPAGAPATESRAGDIPK